MGASNTVVKTPEGKLIGYNTDGVGFYTSLVEEGKINVEESTFFCFGAGGAACRYVQRAGLSRSQEDLPSPTFYGALR